MKQKPKCTKCNLELQYLPSHGVWYCKPCNQVYQHARMERKVAPTTKQYSVK